MSNPQATDSSINGAFHNTCAIFLRDMIIPQIVEHLRKAHDVIIEADELSKLFDLPGKAKTARVVQEAFNPASVRAPAMSDAVKPVSKAPLSRDTCEPGITCAHKFGGTGINGGKYCHRKCEEGTQFCLSHNKSKAKARGTAKPVTINPQYSGSQVIVSDQPHKIMVTQYNDSTQRDTLTDLLYTTNQDGSKVCVGKVSKTNQPIPLVESDYRYCRSNGITVPASAPHATLTVTSPHTAPVIYNPSVPHQPPVAVPLAFGSLPAAPVSSMMAPVPLHAPVEVDPSLPHSTELPSFKPVRLAARQAPTIPGRVVIPTLNP
jgi:hypothetical protein